jgi:hypothetical protein
MDNSYQQKISHQSCPCKTFCGILIGSNVGINATCVSTKANELVEKISRLKKMADSNNNTSPSTPTFDYSTLQQDHLEMKACAFFHLSQMLTSFLWEACRRRSGPKPEIQLDTRGRGVLTLT